MPMHHSPRTLWKRRNDFPHVTVQAVQPPTAHLYVGLDGHYDLVPDEDISDDAVLCIDNRASLIGALAVNDEKRELVSWMVGQCVWDGAQDGTGLLVHKENPCKGAETPPAIIRTAVHVP